MRNRLAITALVAFLLLDVVLVGLALRHVAPVHEAAPQPGTDPAAVSSPAPSSPAAAPTAAPTPSADA
ncbi:MAG: hypothetical protein ACXVXG_18700, partial [Nocardioidaceae bacterium]